MRKLLSCLLFVVLAQMATISNAAVPQGLNFQSKLNTAGGGLFNGQVDLTFEFFTDPAGTATTGWSEVHSAVVVNDSVYSVAIGSVTDFSTVPDLFGQPLFMRISIFPLTDETGAALPVPGPLEVMSPLLPFRSVAYSFFAENINDDSVSTAKIQDDAVTGDQISDGSITSADIGNNAVGLDELANNSVDSSAIQLNAVGADEIAGNAVGASELADDSVDSGAIQPDAVGASELADNSVDSGAIQAGSIGADKLVADSITAALIAPDTITSADIGNNAVGAAELANNAVGTDELQNLAVTSAKIADGAITADKITGGAVPNLDADLLDGLDSPAFFQLSENETVAGLPKFEQGIKFNDDSVQTAAVPTGGANVIVAVDCGSGDKIQDALDAALPGGLLTINVTGTCAETVSIRRDRVELKGSGGATIVGQDEFQGAVNVSKVQGVWIDNIDLQSDALVKASAYGLFVADKGEVNIKDSTVSNAQYGILGVRNGQLRMDAVDVNNVLEYGIVLVDGANARIERSNIIVDLPESGLYEAAIEVNRGASLRMRTDNVISNAGSGKRITLSVSNGGQFRIDKGTNTITGDIEIGNLTNMSLRNFTLVGNINVGTNSTLNIRGTSGSTDITGNVNINHGDMNTSSDVVIDGNINAWEQGSVTLGQDNSVTGEVIVNRGVLAVSDNTTISGPVRVEQASFGGYNGITLNDGFEASQSKVGFWGTGSSYNGFIRISDHSRLTIEGSHQFEEPIECASSTLGLNDSTVFDPSNSSESFRFNQCEFYSGNGSQITGDIYAGNSSSVQISDGSTFNGNLRLEGSGLGMDGSVTFNGEIQAVIGSTLHFGNNGATTISGRVELESGSHASVEQGPVFSSEFRCNDSALYFNNTTFGPIAPSPVIEAYKSCDLSFGDNVIINGDVQVGIGSKLDMMSSSQLNGDLRVTGTSLNMSHGAGIGGSLDVHEHSSLNMFDDNGTPGANDITGGLTISRSSAEIRNNLTSVTDISVRDHSNLRIGGNLAWVLSNQITVENFSHVEFQTYDGPTSLTRSGGGNIFGIQDNSSVRLDNGTMLSGDIGMGQGGSSFSTADDVTVDGAIYAGSHAALSFGKENIVTVNINCDGTDGIVSGTEPLVSTGGAATDIFGCTSRAGAGPTISIAAPSSASWTTGDGPIDYIIIYAGWDTINLLDIDVALNSTGTAAASTVTVLNGTTSTPTVRIDGITGTGTLGISIAADTASDTDGYNAAETGPSDTFTVTP